MELDKASYVDTCYLALLPSEIQERIAFFCDVDGRETEESFRNRILKNQGARYHYFKKEKCYIGSKRDCISCKDFNTFLDANFPLYGKVTTSLTVASSHNNEWVVWAKDFTEIVVCSMIQPHIIKKRIDLQPYKEKYQAKSPIIFVATSNAAQWIAFANRRRVFLVDPTNHSLKTIYDEEAAAKFSKRLLFASSRKVTGNMDSLLFNKQATCIGFKYSAVYLEAHPEKKENQACVIRFRPEAATTLAGYFRKKYVCADWNTFCEKYGDQYSGERK